MPCALTDINDNNRILLIITFGQLAELATELPDFNRREAEPLEALAENDVGDALDRPTTRPPRGGGSRSSTNLTMWGASVAA